MSEGYEYIIEVVEGKENAEEKINDYGRLGYKLVDFEVKVQINLDRFYITMGKKRNDK
ncbi:hypothetical protein [Salinibacter ruber]|uniref:hypothetical protein n=1 Tax=Salinibacter ruber TaxID=146919 RepID=UPI00216827B1|nr:hypothetical protein [Salinibacter ruber]MCS4184931.1 hypothetical protein [Salinibacter ruber]